MNLIITGKKFTWVAVDFRSTYKVYTVAKSTITRFSVINFNVDVDFITWICRITAIIKVTSHVQISHKLLLGNVVWILPPNSDLKCSNIDNVGRRTDGTKTTAVKSTYFTFCVIIISSSYFARRRHCLHLIQEAASKRVFKISLWENMVIIIYFILYTTSKSSIQLIMPWVPHKQQWSYKYYIRDGTRRLLYGIGSQTHHISAEAPWPRWDFLENEQTYEMINWSRSSKRQSCRPRVTLPGY